MRLSEGLNAGEESDRIRQVISCRVCIIVSETGTIDKFIGDAVMVFWGAPLDDPDMPRKLAVPRFGWSR